MPVKRRRLDQELVERGLAATREAARRAIVAGDVMVMDQRAIKPSQPVVPEARIELRHAAPYVSRGGEKLAGALDAFDLSPQGHVCLDVGASTGGFTDCLLQRGAAHVFAVDVGHGQLAWSLRQDERVTVYERVNARTLDPELFDRRITFAVVDVSFISLTLILPAVRQALEPGGTVVTLIKPQFEAGREQVGRGGVVRDPEVHRDVVHRIREAGRALGLTCVATCTSPLKGPAGNVEFFAHWSRP